MGRSAAVSHDWLGMPGISHQPDLLPLQSQAGRGERHHRRLAREADEQPAQLGFWAVLPISAQRKGLQMEPQAGLQDLPRARAEPANQAAPPTGAREAVTGGGADGDQPELVDGFHA